MALGGRDVGVTPSGGRVDGGWDKGDLDLYLQDSDHGGAVQSYSPHSGPMLGYGEEAKITGNAMVVGT